MQYRPFGTLGWKVSSIGFGAWAIGGFWGKVDDTTSMRALHAAADAGVNFFDTADVYGDGRSERLVGRLLRERPVDVLHVTTKAGRRLEAQTVDGYSRANLTQWVDDSLRNLQVDVLELVQLHCPPAGVYERDEVFGVLDDLTTAGKVRYWGTSVESIDEARLALKRPLLRSLQIVFNVFRQRPAEALFAEALAAGVAVIARVPLASGLLTGRIGADTTFPEDDHRNFNRHGERFDVGETFSGVPLDAALPAVDELRALVTPPTTVGQLALRWILMYDAVACAIPGARTALQAQENAVAAELPRLQDATMAAIRDIYDRRIRPHVHHRW